MELFSLIMHGIAMTFLEISRLRNDKSSIKFLCLHSFLSERNEMNLHTFGRFDCFSERNNDSCLMKIVIASQLPFLKDWWSQEQHVHTPLVTSILDVY